jgi:hypothetical protein
MEVAPAWATAPFAELFAELPGEACSKCGRAGVEPQASVATGEVTCLRCYLGAQRAEPLGMASPCPGCGEPRGARYVHQGRALCWPCWSRRNPAPRRHRPKPTAYARLVDRVWAALEARGTVLPLCDGSGMVLGYCPSCGIGTIAIRIVDVTPPQLDLDGCSDGCTVEQLKQAI